MDYYYGWFIIRLLFFLICDVECNIGVGL